MVRPLPVDYLQPGERPLTVQDRRMASVIDAYLGLVVLWVIVVGGLIALVTVAPPIAPFAVPVGITVTLAVLFGAFLVYRRTGTTRYVVTGERVYAAVGRLVFRLDQTTYDKVTDLHVHQSMFGRWLGFGTVTVQTAGHGIRLAGVHGPLAVKNAIEEARASYIDTLIEQHLSVRGSARAATPSAETEWLAIDDAAPEPRRVSTKRPDQHVWSGKPAKAWIAASVMGTIAGLIIPFAFVSIGVTSSLGPQVLIYIIPAFLLFAAASIAGAIIRYKYTTYEIRSRGVVVSRGWLSRQRIETSYDKVTDVGLHQGIMARMFGFGTISINTAGSNEAPVVFVGVPDPERVKGMIDDARDGP